MRRRKKPDLDVLLDRCLEAFVQAGTLDLSLDQLARKAGSSKRMLDISARSDSPGSCECSLGPHDCSSIERCALAGDGSFQARLVGFETREAVLCRAAKAVDRAPHEVFARSFDGRRNAAGFSGSGSGILGHWRSQAGKASADANPREPRELEVARLTATRAGFCLPGNCEDNAAVSLVVSDHCAELTIL
jgi:hypothetical protein